MQAAINPALAAALTLDRAAQVGDFTPVTKDGTPTVVGGLMQKVMPPAVPEVVQQAGLGAQIRDMQMKEAQSAVMNQAMQQAKGPAGLEGLNPEMGNFAEGGIVGYAGAGTAREEMNPLVALLRKIGEVGLPTRGGLTGDRAANAQSPDERERALEVLAASTPMMEIPEVAVREDRPAPPPVERQPSAARPSGETGGIGSLFEKERAGYRSMKGPASSEEIMAQEQREAAIQDQYLRSKGLPTTAEMFAARGAEDKSLMEQQRGLLRERMEREKGRDTFLGRMGEALRGFSQMQGQGIGSGVVRSYDALSRRLEAGEARMDQMRDFELKLNELEINRRRALDDARRATAEGDWKRAQQRMGEANAFENAQKKLEASTFGEQAKAVLEERKIAEAAAGRGIAAETNRLSAMQSRLNAAQGQFTNAKDKWEKQTAEKYPILKIAFQPGGDKLLQDPAMRSQYEQASQAARDDYIKAVAPAEATLKRLQQEVLGGQSTGGMTPSQQAAMAKYGAK